MKVAVIYNKREIKAKDVVDIFGPRTKEKYNPKTVERVATALENGGHNVKIIEGNIEVAEELQQFMPRVIAGERQGMVFNMAYGIQGQSRYTHIPAMLEMLGIPYVGSGPQAHAIALDKVMTKIVLQRHALSTPNFWFFSTPELNMEGVEFPVIVKPRMEAVSMGLRIVDNEEDLRQAVRFVIETFQQQALVESFIPGREFAVGLLGNGNELQMLPIVEFDFGGDPNAIQTQEEKMRRPVQKVCPASISDEQGHKIRELARGAFEALGISDFARIDLRMNDQGELFILELNSMASLGLTGTYVHSANVAGYTFESLVNRMLDVAGLRYFGAAAFQAPEPAEQTQDETKPLRVRVRTYLRSNRTDIVNTLRHLVDINSYVHNTEGVNKLGNLVATRLAQFGFQRQIFPQSEVGHLLYLTNHHGEQNDILVLGHLDTRYNYQEYRPFSEERGKLYGSGVAESKGGLAVLLAALQALRSTRRIKKIRCGILLTSDNTLGGRHSKKLIEEMAGRSKKVVGLKYGDLSGGIVTSCSGGAQFQYELSNVKKASSATPDVIKTICQKIIAWQKLSAEESGISVTPDKLEAHTLYGMTPDYASGSLWVQFKNKPDGEKLEREIREIARKGLGSKFQLLLKKRMFRPPVSESDVSFDFFRHVQEIAKRLEIRCVPVHRENPSDICYVPAEVPVLEGMGPLGDVTQSHDEVTLRDSLVDRAALLAMVIRLSAEGRS